MGLIILKNFKFQNGFFFNPLTNNTNKKITMFNVNLLIWLIELIKN